MNKTITIKATQTVSSFARRAFAIQNAINSLAVTTFLQDVQKHFREGGNEQEISGGEICIQNPISILVLDKLNSLARMEQSSVIKADIACEQLGNGQDIQWEVEMF